MSGCVEGGKPVSWRERGGGGDVRKTEIPPWTLKM